jgi:putative Ca2+/H+ antiporter (TMEM165/GDT1 family)
MKPVIAIVGRPNVGKSTFLLVSLLMAYANYRIRFFTHSSAVVTIISFLGLLAGTLMILYYEYSTQIEQMIFIGGLYLVLTLASWFYSKNKTSEKHI